MKEECIEKKGNKFYIFDTHTACRARSTFKRKEKVTKSQNGSIRRLIDPHILIN